MRNHSTFFLLCAAAPRWGADHRRAPNYPLYHSPHILSSTFFFVQLAQIFPKCLCILPIVNTVKKEYNNIQIGTEISTSH